MNPYDLLGVTKNATDKDLKAAYRRAVKDAHPDKGGNEQKFREVQEAFDVLIDPDRRRRFDTTGRLDKSRVTPDRIRQFIDQTIQNVVSHKNGSNGMPDDPTSENVRDKILVSMARARSELQNMRHETQRKQARATKMLQRFKPNKDTTDYVGDALRAELIKLDEEMNNHEDAMEMSQEVEKVLKSYGYEVGPESQGQQNSRPTIRRTYL